MPACEIRRNSEIELWRASHCLERATKKGADRSRRPSWSPAFDLSRDARAPLLYVCVNPVDQDLCDLVAVRFGHHLVAVAEDPDIRQEEVRSITTRGVDGLDGSFAVRALRKSAPVGWPCNIERQVKPRAMIGCSPSSGELDVMEKPRGVRGFSGSIEGTSDGSLRYLGNFLHFDINPRRRRCN